METLQNVSILINRLNALKNKDITKSEKVIEKDFIYRLVYCYEEKDKYINLAEYNNKENTIKELEQKKQNTKDDDKVIADIDKTIEKVKAIKKEYTPEYKLIVDLVNKINRLDFDYTIKQNKYIYLLHRTDINNNETFNAMQKIDDKGNFKNTINQKNIKQVYSLLNDILIEKLVNAKKATAEETKLYNDNIKKLEQETKKETETK